MLKASIIGNLGNDPDMKYSANGAPFLRFNIASNFRARNPEGQWEDRTEWVRVTVFGQRAESLGQYLHKGQLVYVDGRLEARPWTDQQGNVRAGLELVASDVEFMSARNDDDQSQGERQTAQARPASQGQPAQQPAGKYDNLDDVPF